MDRDEIIRQRKGGGMMKKMTEAERIKKSVTNGLEDNTFAMMMFDALNWDKIADYVNGKEDGHEDK